MSLMPREPCLECQELFDRLQDRYDQLVESRAAAYQRGKQDGLELAIQAIRRAEALEGETK